MLQTGPRLAMNNAELHVRYDLPKLLRQVLFVVQVVIDINKRDSVHCKRIPQSTKMRICIHHQ